MFAEGNVSPIRVVAPSFVTPAPIEPQIQSLFSQQPIERLKINTTVFREGDVATHVFVVLEGLLRVVKILTGGRRVITGFVYPGEILGVSLRTPYFCTAEAMTPSIIRRLTHGQFRQAMNGSSQMQARLIQRLCEDLAAADDRMVLLARKTAEERVCSLLLMMARRLRQDGLDRPVIDVPMCRLDMADYLGLTKETVCRAIARLANLGVIATSGRHIVVIRSFEKLVLHAGEADGECDAAIFDLARHA